MPADATTVIEGASAAILAVATSSALFRNAPAVVLAGADDKQSQADAAGVAVKLGVPLLLVAAPGEGLKAEIDRLGPSTIVALGEAATAWARSTYPAGGDSPDIVAGDALPAVTPEAPLADLLALTQDDGSAAAVTAKAAGARVLELRNPDPRASADAITALAGQATARVVALGSAFGPADRLRQRIDTAATGVQLPGGGQVVFPGRRMVALYGHPGSNVLGSMGEQPLPAAIARAKKVAASYSSLVDEPVIPAFEIIATVASAGAGSDGNYSNEVSISKLKPWVVEAGKAGLYVMLDLQPGRTDFLTQAKQYEELLKLPHVGLALDPEWRLGRNEIHMVQIGSVRASEVNATAQWLAELTRVNHLPQKVLMLHQFRLDMITDRSTVRTDYDELRIVIHVDGFGGSSQKMATWRTINRNAPAGVFWGWKNFYDEDKPTFTPKQTYAVKPNPVFVSYQ